MAKDLRATRDYMRDKRAGTLNGRKWTDYKNGGSKDSEGPSSNSKHDLTTSTYDLVNDVWINAESGMPTRYGLSRLPDFYALSPDDARRVNTLYSDVVSNMKVVTDKKTGEQRVMLGSRKDSMSVRDVRSWLQHNATSQAALLSVGYTAPELHKYESDNGPYRGYDSPGRNRAAYNAAIYAAADKHLTELLRKKK